MLGHDLREHVEDQLVCAEFIEMLEGQPNGMREAVFEDGGENLDLLAFSAGSSAKVRNGLGPACLRLRSVPGECKGARQGDVGRGAIRIAGDCFSEGSLRVSTP